MNHAMLFTQSAVSLFKNLGYQSVTELALRHPFGRPVITLDAMVPLKGSGIFVEFLCLHLLATDMCCVSEPDCL